LKVLFALIATLFSTVAMAQTISPPNAECSAKHCVGTFTITNDMLTPMAVTIKPMSIGITADGKLLFRELDATTDLKLSAMSARLGPKEVFAIDYKVKCAVAPCTIDFAASMMAVQHADSGAVIRLVLNHIVYVCPKEKDCRLNTLKAVGYLK
jgi:hypothetical protein